MYIQRPLCLASAAFVLFMFILVSIFPAAIPQEILDMDKTKVTITGRVDKKEIKGDYLNLNISDVRIESKIITGNMQLNNVTDGSMRLRYRIVLQLPADEILIDDVKIGSRIKARGTFRLYEHANNEGEFDARKYYLVKGYAGYVTCSKLTAKSESYNRIKEYLFNVRRRCGQVFEDYMNEQDSSVMEAVILGDKTELDPDIKEIYVNAGIAHILSLSGLHIAAVGLFILRLLKKLPISPAAANIIATLLVATYAEMTGMSLSTVRALIMFIICVIAGQIGRTYDLLNSAALSCAIILIGNPYLVQDSGFGLSFGAIIGIACVYPYMKRLVNINRLVYINRLGKSGNATFRLISKIIDGLIASTAINLATLPITLSAYYKINLYSVFLNIIVIPLMSVLLMCGFAAVITALMMGTSGMAMIANISLFNICGSNLCRILLEVAHRILELYRSLATFVIKAPGSRAVLGKPHITACVCYYIILILCGILIELEIGRGVVVTFILLAFSVLTGKIEKPVEVINLAVGQGDCSVIKGSDMPVIVIDGGSSSEKEIGKYTIKPFLLSNGIGKIEYMIITHADTDHVNGLLEILSDESGGITVENIIISEASMSMPEVTVPVINMKAGDILRGDEFELLCLSPIKVSGGNENEDSLVLKLTHYDSNFKALFTGDMGQETEEEILKPDYINSLFKENSNVSIREDSGENGKEDGRENGKEGRKENRSKNIRDILDADYLKVAHHGSKNSSTADFLEEVSPLISVLSVPEKSVYGHPHAETVERLESSGSRILRTDEKGQINIYPTRKGIVIESYLE